MERVADVLGRKYPQFNTVSPQHFVSDALYQMCAENIDYLIVLDNDRFSGLITSSDIANKVLFVDKPLKEIQVHDFMNTNLPVATLNDSIEHSLHLMERYKSKYLVVYDRFDFKGVVTAHELMREALLKRNAVDEKEMKEEKSFSRGY